MLPTVVSLTKTLQIEILREGDCAIDATVGRGQDTHWLAETVGPSGLVIGFDIQAEALAATRERLVLAGLLDRFEARHCGHEKMESVVTKELVGSRPIRSVIFNLGYLPLASHSITTRFETTLPGLEASLKLLVTGGLLTVAVYPGHAGGDDESDAVTTWAQKLDPNRAEVAAFTPWNTRRPSPWLLMVTKRK